jgi:uncharacterized OB-fold protein/acyl dehydratase
VTADNAGAAIRQAAARIAALGESSPRPAPDAVNMPMIRHWVQAMGDTNPVYTDARAAARSVHGGLVAPPAMTQVWTMRGLDPGDSDSGDPLGLMSAALDEAGFTSVVATNSEQEYYRYLRLGEHVTVRSSLEGVTGPKRTALGAGWFVTTRSTWSVGTEAVASMRFRILKFRPAPSPAPPEAPVPAADVLRPVVSPDTAFFWAGTARHELRIQRCGGCGVLRHPPGPMCPACGAARPEYDVAAGTGEVYSYVVHHHPLVPGRKLPIVVALVQLTEGVRMVGELLGTDPDGVRVGLPVRVTFVQVDGDLTLPAWREDKPQAPGRTPHGAGLRAAGAAKRSTRWRDSGTTHRGGGHELATEAGSVGAGASGPGASGTGASGTGAVLPELVIDVTPTSVIAAAIATRDFQDVHHDRDRAVERGGKDIFVNILTTTGLVQRYVTDWAGPQAMVRQIAIRLGVPCYAGDKLTFSGRVAQAGGGEGTGAGECAGAGAGGHARAGGGGHAGWAGQECVVEVVGRCGLGDHVTGTVRIGPGRPCDPHGPAASAP